MSRTFRPSLCVPIGIHEIDLTRERQVFKIGDFFINDCRDSLHVVTAALPPDDDCGEPRVSLGWSDPLPLSKWLDLGWSPCTPEEWELALRDLHYMEYLDRES